MCRCGRHCFLQEFKGSAIVGEVQRHGVRLSIFEIVAVGEGKGGRTGYWVGRYTFGLPGGRGQPKGVDKRTEVEEVEVEGVEVEVEEVEVEGVEVEGVEVEGAERSRKGVSVLDWEVYL